MKNIIITLLLMIPFWMNAQFKASGYLSQQIGMEKNPLRNPSSLLSEDGEYFEQSELVPLVWQSNTTTYLRLQQKWDKVTLNIKPKVSYLWYPALAEANLLRINLNQQLEYKLTKRWKIYQTSFYTKRQRNGDDLAEEVFTLPRSYFQTGAGLGVNYKVNKYWNIDWQNTFFRNQFLTEGDIETSYRAIRSKLELQGKWKKAEVFKGLNVQAQWERRNWERILFFEVEEDEEEEEPELLSSTLMNYLKTRVSTQIQLSDQLVWSPYVEVLNRNSSINNQDYINYKLGSGLTWEQNALEIIWKAYIAQRNFPTLRPGQSSNQKLAYLYVSNSLKVNYNLKENWTVYFVVKNINRNSNFNDEIVRTFRSYIQFYYGFGVKFRF